MKRLVAMTVLFALIARSPAWGQERQKGNFVLIIQGGRFGNLEDRFFKSTAWVVSGGLEYFPLNLLSAGIQFQFSPKGTFGSPVTLGVGSISGSGSRRSGRLFQTALFARPILAAGPTIKFFALAGVALTKVARTSEGVEVASGSGASENETTKLGAKLGGGTFVHLKSNVHLNFSVAFDTQPQKLLSAQVGLSFFFNPFSKELPQSGGNLLFWKGYK